MVQRHGSVKDFQLIHLWNQHFPAKNLEIHETTGPNWRVQAGLKNFKMLTVILTKKQGKIGKPQTMFSSNWDITSPGGRRWETEFGEIGEKIIRWWESGKPGRLGRQRGFCSSFLLQRRDAGGGRVLGQAAQLPPLPPSHQKPQQLSQSPPPGFGGILKTFDDFQIFWTTFF